MAIKFVLMVNKAGTVRLAKFFTYFPPAEQIALEAEIVRKCLARAPTHSSFFDHEAFKIIYRRYAALYIVVAVDHNENELAVLEMIHLFISALDTYFDDVCELDILFSLDRVHMLLDEIVVNGDIVETNLRQILEPVQLLDRKAKKDYGLTSDFTETMMENISNFFQAGMIDSD